VCCLNLLGVSRDGGGSVVAVDRLELFPCRFRLTSSLEVEFAGAFLPVPPISRRCGDARTGIRLGGGETRLLPLLADATPSTLREGGSFRLFGGLSTKSTGLVLCAKIFRADAVSAVGAGGSSMVTRLLDGMISDGPSTIIVE
jgi:hypothetical protein